MNGNPDYIMYQLYSNTMSQQPYNHTYFYPQRIPTNTHTCMQAQRWSHKHVASISHQITYILNNTTHMLLWNVKAWCLWAAHDAYASACG